MRPSICASGWRKSTCGGSEWQSMDETAYLTSSAANHAALSQSLKEAEDGRTVEIEL